jgi:hypothetical protein
MNWFRAKVLAYLVTRVTQPKTKPCEDIHSGRPPALPLSRRETDRVLVIEEKVAILAALHDTVCFDFEKIGQWPRYGPLTKPPILSAAAEQPPGYVSQLTPWGWWHYPHPLDSTVPAEQWPIYMAWAVLMSRAEELPEVDRPRINAILSDVREKCRAEQFTSGPTSSPVGVHMQNDTSTAPPPAGGPANALDFTQILDAARRKVAACHVHQDMLHALGDVYNFSAKTGRVTPELLREIMVEVEAWLSALIKKDLIEETRHRAIFCALAVCLKLGRSYGDPPQDSLPLGRPRLEEALWNLHQLVTCRPGATDQEKMNALNEVLKSSPTGAAATTSPTTETQPPSGTDIGYDLDTLPEREQEILQALLLLGADSPRRRQSVWQTTRRVDPSAKPNSYKGQVASLVKQGLVESQKGPGGGIWLTAQGKSIAERFGASPHQ